MHKNFSQTFVLYQIKYYDSLITMNKGTYLYSLNMELVKRTRKDRFYDVHP